MEVLKTANNNSTMETKGEGLNRKIVICSLEWSIYIPFTLTDISGTVIIEKPTLYLNATLVSWFVILHLISNFSKSLDIFEEEKTYTQNI